MNVDKEDTLDDHEIKHGSSLNISQENDADCLKLSQFSCLVKIINRFGCYT